MKCDKIRELILTDYVDGQLVSSELKKLEAHLNSCKTCHEFAATVQRELAAPFEELEKVEPPVVIWENIKKAVTPVEEKLSTFDTLVRFFGNLQTLRQTALLMAGVVIVLGVAFLVTRKEASPTQMVQEQKINVQLVANEKPMLLDEETLEEEYLAYLADDYAAVDDIFEGYGTAIEEYFL